MLLNSQLRLDIPTCFLHFFATKHFVCISQRSDLYVMYHQTHHAYYFCSLWFNSCVEFSKHLFDFVI